MPKHKRGKNMRAWGHLFFDDKQMLKEADRLDRQQDREIGAQIRRSKRGYLVPPECDWRRLAKEPTDD